MRRLFPLVVSAVMSLVAACGGSSEHPADTAAFCRDACARVFQCRSEVEAALDDQTSFPDAFGQDAAACREQCNASTQEPVDDQCLACLEADTCDAFAPCLVSACLHQEDDPREEFCPLSCERVFSCQEEFTSLLGDAAAFTATFGDSETTCQTGCFALPDLSSTCQSCTFMTFCNQFASCYLSNCLGD